MSHSVEKRETWRFLGLSVNMQEKIAMPSDEQSWAEGSQFSIPVDEQISKWCQLTKTCFMISDGWMSLYPPRCGSLRGWQFQTYSDHQATASTFVPVLILWLTSNWPFASTVVTMIFHCRSNRDVWNLRSSESQHSTPIPSWTNFKKMPLHLFCLSPLNYDGWQVDHEWRCVFPTEFGERLRISILRTMKEIPMSCYFFKLVTGSPGLHSIREEHMLMGNNSFMISSPFVPQHFHFSPTQKSTPGEYTPHRGFEESLQLASWAIS